MKNNLFYRHWTGIVCLMCVLVFNVNVWAAEFEVDGIYYSTLTSNTVQVVKPTSGKYTGDIAIPATVYNGQTYQVVAIGDYAFQGANQVTSVTLPLVGITSIGSFAFNDCTGLTSFMLPASITSIGERAFYLCDNLHDLYVCATDPASYNPGNMAFSKIHYGSHKCTLHVPTGCTAAYAADPTFSVFTQVEEFDPPQPVLYDLYVAGIQVTEDNASDILGNGTVSYSAGTKTLTLNGANIEASGATDMEDTGIYIGVEDVTILVIGESTIDADIVGIHFTKDATITGSEQLIINNEDGDNAIRMSENSLTIDGANLVLSSEFGGLKGAGANTLTIKSSTITATADPDYSAPALDGSWQDVQLIDCYIELPEGGEYNWYYGVVDKNGDSAQEVRIKPGVAPVLYDIYIAGTQVTEDNASDILEDGGTVSYNAETKTLTLNGANIYASGETDKEDTGIYIGEEDVTILVIGESTITSNYNGIYLTKDATITGSEQLSIDDHMGSCIAMYNNSLTIFDANLVLSSLYGSGISGSGANVLLIMNSTITATADPDYSAPALGGGWKDVQLIDCYIELPEEGKYDPEKGVVDKNDVPAQDASIKPGVAPVFYDIYVKGIHVSDQNASDILGNGTVSYSAGTKILTLDGANIEADGATDMEKTGIYVGEEDVIILVIGASYINADNEGIYLTKDATITGSEELTIDANVGSAIYMKNNSLTINGANLVLSSLYGSGISGSGANVLLIMNSTITATADPDYSAPALGGGWKDVQLIDCYIELPEEGKYDPEKGVVDKNGDPAQEVRIKLSSYTITWKNDDGSTIDQTVVEYGQTPTHADPSKPATAEFTYTFAGWTPAIVAVTGDATYTATYNSTINTYTVTFVDYNDAVLKSETVEYGKAAIAPADPKREGYTFTGWDKDFSNITADLTVKAQYKINVYTVTFLDKDGKTIKTEKVEHGKSATAPEAPVVEGWTFAGWDKAFNVVTSDLTVKATYTQNHVYTVTFVDYDGSVIATVKVEEGKSAVKPDDPIREGYTFAGWDKKFDNVKSDLTVTAQYAINTYTVTFVDYDNKELKKETVEWGKSATAPADPTREGYTFKGWDKDFSNITADLTVKAQYKINVYTVTFLDKDGKTIKTEKVEYGSAATAPEAPVVEGWTFAGWDKAFSNVTSDLTITALYEALSDFVPQNLTVELVGVGESDTQITLSWDKVEGAFSYDLRLAIGEKELFTRNTMTLTSLTALLSQIEEQYHLTPGTYLIDWFVRSTDKNGEAISEWAQGESFEVTIKEPQGIEEQIVNRQSSNRKFIKDGLLYIIRGGRTYDSNGKLVQ